MKAKATVSDIKTVDVDSTMSMSVDAREQLVLELLQHSLGNVKIEDPAFLITPEELKLDEPLEETFQTYRTGKKLHKATFCTVRRIEALDDKSQARARGLVFPLRGQDEDCTQGMTIPIHCTIPVPLLSISLSCRSKKKKSSLASPPALLQQCMKRLLVGTLVVCPRRSESEEMQVLSVSSPSPASSSSSSSSSPSLITYKYRFAEACRSIISLQAPSLKYSHESFTYQVCNVSPNYIGKTSYGSKTPRANIFIILPSTRITLEAGIDKEIELLPVANEATKQLDVADDTEQMGDIKSIKVKSITEDIVFETIKAIRKCSILRSRFTARSTDTSIIDIPRAFLLTGPPGVGKTHSVRTSVQFANSTVMSTKLISLRGSEILSNTFGAASEIKRQFTIAAEFARKEVENVSVMFLDECDALLGDDTASATLAALLDKMTAFYGELSNNDRRMIGWKRIIVVAATNRIDAIPSNLRRPGRIDREICIPPPNKEQRFNILSTILMDLNSPEEFSKSGVQEIDKDELAIIAELCVGYVAADLSSLVRRASLLAIKNGRTTISSSELRDAMKDVGASALRDSTINAPPSTRWSDIAGDAGGAKTALRRAVEWPITKKKEFAILGLKSPRGILLHGPPGCAKTTLAKAAAGAAGIAFLSLSPADVYSSSYVGEAEAVVRRAFSLARSASPCILFFDEIDSVVASSSNNKSGMDRGSNAEARVLSTFLNEMDGVDGSLNDGVLVLGATNRPATLDSALLRPGRFDRVIYVPPPDEEGRRMIFQAQCDAWSKSAGRGDIDVDYLSRDQITGLMTGAEIVGACREAAMLAIRESFDTSVGSVHQTPKVFQHHLQKSLDAIKPLLSNPEILKEYTSFEDEHTK